MHAKGSFIYIQLWAVGRVAHADVLTREGYPVVSASAKPVKGGEVPHALTVPEIQQFVRDYAQASRNAIEAGFDGVEIHGANGYLVDQFLQDVSNERTDEYGGSIEGRSRFGLEVVKAIADTIGPDRTAIRLSPWSVFQGWSGIIVKVENMANAIKEMGMVDPTPQFLHFINSLREDHPNLAYIHVLQPSVENGVRLPGSNDAFREAWAPRPFLSADGHDRDSALRDSAQYGDVIVFGRHFIANVSNTDVDALESSLTACESQPDLPRRLKEQIPLNSYDRHTFYTPESAAGYTDYPFAETQQVAQQARL